MIKMINCFTGTEFWVADDRVDEYTAAGHILAAESEKPTAEETKEVEKVEEKKTTKKTTKAKK